MHTRLILFAKLRMFAFCGRLLSWQAYQASAIILETLLGSATNSPRTKLKSEITSHADDKLQRKLPNQSSFPCLTKITTRVVDETEVLWQEGHWFKSSYWLWNTGRRKGNSCSNASIAPFEQDTWPQPQPAPRAPLSLASKSLTFAGSRAVVRATDCTSAFYIFCILYAKIASSSGLLLGNELWALVAKYPL